jgi:hypothetical protein
MIPKEVEKKILDEEIRYIAEIAYISSVDVATITKVIETQLNMILRDLGVNGEAQTLIGKVKLDMNNNLVLEIPNSQIKRLTNRDFLTEKMMREFD